MVTEDSRQKSRREGERRANERRVIPYAFGSDEWCKIIQEEYLLWPKKDRRISDRRVDGRRKGSRRDRNNIRTQRAAPPIKNLSSLLTDEEREMINELIRSDNVE